MSLKRTVALLLCGALALGLLAGCSGKAASSEAAPSSTAEASASGILPSEDENSLLTFTDPAAAFEPCIGWGAGTAGTSLKAMAGAAAMLEWAEDNNFANQSQTAAKSLLQKWYDGLTEVQQEGFAEAWPLIKADASALLTDKESVSGLADDAGLNIKKLPGCSQKNWDAFAKVLDGIVPDAPQQ